MKRANELELYKFPVKIWFENGKRKQKPCIQWKRAASSDPAQWAAWEKQFTPRLKPGEELWWAIHCGMSSITVIDLDVKDGRDGVEAWTAFKIEHDIPLDWTTATARTKTGGLHLITAGTAACGNLNSVLGPGIDIKTNTGYVYEYPIINDALVAPLPDAVSHFRPAAPEREHSDTPLYAEDQPHQIMQAYEYIKDRAPVTESGSGRGADTVYQVACHLRDLGVSQQTALQLMLQYNEVKVHPQPETAEYIHDTTRNAYRYAKNRQGAADALSMLASTPIPESDQTTISLADAILDSTAFGDMHVTPKKMLLDPWLTEQSITLVSGWRGAGKTWFVLSVLKAITSAGTFGDAWRCDNPVPCLYLDGEMTVHDDQDRLRYLQIDDARKAPLYIYADSYANSLGLPRARLTNPEWRKEMAKFLKDSGIKLWVADNIASLAPGLDENAKKDWDPINQWLLDLRFAGISTVLLHHTGKNGDQRGASSREDNIDTSVRLLQPRNYKTIDGARFICRFGKNRVKGDQTSLIADREFQLIYKDNVCSWVCTTAMGSSIDVVATGIMLGKTQKQIADELGCSPAHVSKLKKKAIETGAIVPEDILAVGQ
jgi:hypothetical protein